MTTRSRARRRCAALLLTGGASRRFGSPKALVAIEGTSLADRLAAALTAVASPVLEVGPGYSHLESICEQPPGSGPLAALSAGLDALAARGASGRHALVVAVDLPSVDVAVLEYLRDHDTAQAVVPRVAGVAQPLCARYPPKTAEVARDLLSRGARSMHALLDAIGVTWVDDAQWSAVTSGNPFADFDTPDDLRRIGLGDAG